MKRLILPFAALTLVAASCSTDTKDSTGSITYYDYNLIIDKENPDVKAQATYGSYEFELNITQAKASIKANDLIINNQKFSFETDTMACRPLYFKTTLNGEETTVGQTIFSKSGPAGVGSAASNMKGALLGMYVPTSSDSLSSNFYVTLQERLDLNYTLSDRYQVQTFWPSSLYLGQTYAADSQNSLSTRTPKYVVNINFPKNKATVFVYNSELSASGEDLPKVIRIGDIPVMFDHDSYYLEASQPKTTVLGKRNNTPTLIDSVGFQVEDFSLRLTSEDLTDAIISYKLRGKSVTFSGSSVPKAGR